MKIPAEMLAREIAYVNGATSTWRRVYRAMRAAIRCSIVARREKK